jgi:hypothetical protein
MNLMSFNNNFHRFFLPKKQFTLKAFFLFGLFDVCKNKKKHSRIEGDEQNGCCAAMSRERCGCTP